MNDRAVALLEAYDLEIYDTKKGRGSIICNTPKGCCIFKEYLGRTERLALQVECLQQLSENPHFQVEELLLTKEGYPYVRDWDNTCYVLKTYREGRECNIYDRAEAQEGVRILGHLHQALEHVIVTHPLGTDLGLLGELEKRNRQLKKIRRYLQKKSQKTYFELELLSCFDHFYRKAMEVFEEVSYYEEQLSKAPDKILCHGDFQHHNLLRYESQWFLVNFEKMSMDSPMKDLYLMLRKILEKSHWSVELGKRLMDSYQEIRPLSACQLIDLYYRFSYPEKFFKIANFYYNTPKTFIPARNQEKLTRILQMEEEKAFFLEQAFQL